MKHLSMHRCLLLLFGTLVDVRAWVGFSSPRLCYQRHDTPISQQHDDTPRRRCSLTKLFTSTVHDRNDKYNEAQSSTITSSINSTSTDSTSALFLAQSYLSQAQALRQEAENLRHDLQVQAEKAKQRELQRVDQWINETLLALNYGPNNAQVLYSVDQVATILQDRRMSEEHVMRMFRRLQESHAASRSSCSPLVDLLVQAAGVMDALEREVQPNKRWSGKVERKLRRRLFANDWNIDLDELEEQEQKGGYRD